MDRGLMKAAALIAAAVIVLTVVQPVRLAVWALVSLADAVGSFGLLLIVASMLSVITMRLLSDGR